MKILVLLFAVVFLVFQTKSEAVAKDEVQSEAVDLEEAQLQDDTGMEDGAAEMASPGLIAQRALRDCHAKLGICRFRCSANEATLGWCMRGLTCCRKRN